MKPPIPFRPAGIFKRISSAMVITATVFLSIQSSLAQNAATPNPGFEQWQQVTNYFNPVGWNNLNSNTAIVGVFTCTRASAAADVHSGTYAIKLTTKSVFGITANGIASTATLITTPPYGVSGGIPYTERPDSITGWYKYTPASAADSGFVQFVLLGASNDTIAFTIFHTPNTPVTTYTRFSMPVNYLSSGTPALSYWILSASDGVNPVVNSSLLIDDLDLVFNTTGLSDPEDNTSAAGPLNNLAGNELYVFNETTGILNFELTDVSGRVVFRKAMEPGNEVYDVSGFKGGFYFYRIYSSGTELISSGKILKY